MADMFNGCTLLTNLNISNFNMNKVKNMKGMLSNCSDELKNKIRKQNKNIKEEAFL
jgi:surface protein